MLLTFKKGNDNEKGNPGPLTMLSTISKVFDKLLFEQINDQISTL